MRRYCWVLKGVLWGLYRGSFSFGAHLSGDLPPQERPEKALENPVVCLIGSSFGGGDICILNVWGSIGALLIVARYSGF